MSSRELVSVALKVFAVYVLVQAMLVIPPLVSSLVYSRTLQTDQGALLWLWLGGASAVAAALVLAFLIWRLSSAILSDVVLESTTQSVPLQSEIDWEAFILSVLGLFLVLEALVSLGYRATGAYVQLTDPNNPYEIAPETVAFLVCYILQGLIGATLIIKSTGWAKVLRRVRELGLAAKPSVKELDGE